MSPYMGCKDLLPRDCYEGCESCAVMQGAQIYLGYLLWKRSYATIGEGWSDRPPVPAFTKRHCKSFDRACKRCARVVQEHETSEKGRLLNVTSVSQQQRRIDVVTVTKKPRLTRRLRKKSVDCDKGPLDCDNV